MAKNEKKKQNWRDKYRFSVTNDTTFEEVWRIKLTQYNAFLLITSIVLFIIVATVLLVSFTNLKEFIPGYPDVNMRKNILLSAIRLDSLDKELALRDKYFDNLNAIIAGKQPKDVYTLRDSSLNYKSISFNRYPEDSTFKSRVEKDERSNLAGSESSEPAANLAGMHFFTPVKGVVSSKFNKRTKHFGTDIAAKDRSPVNATLDGVVIFTGWTTETGFVIAIQHANNMVSIYKHNSSLLKETGDRVRTGEAIAVVGNSGEKFTSGPHLHLEIWYKGTPLDPEEHITF